MPHSKLSHSIVASSLFAAQALATNAEEVQHSLLLPNWRERAEEGAAFREVIRKTIPPIEMPSWEDIDAVRIAEGADLIINESVDAPFLTNIKRVSRGLYDDIMASGGIVLTSETFLRVAQEIWRTPERVLSSLDLPAETEAIIVLNKFYHSSLHASYFEEVFHLLEGPVRRDPRWDMAANEYFYQARKTLNDFEQLLFCPANRVNQFQSFDSAWTTEQKSALIARYRDKPPFNPNVDMRLIIQNLHADLYNEAEQSFSDGTSMPVSELILQQLSRSYRKHLKPYLKIYTEILLDHERFSHYKPLFPHLEGPIMGGEQGSGAPGEKGPREYARAA